MKKPILALALLIAMLFPAACGTPEKPPKASQGESHYMLGLSYFRQQQLTSALKEFLLAVEADPRNPDFQNALAQAYQFKKALPKAEEHYLQALVLSNNNPQFQNNLAALYLDMQRWDEAIKYFRAASSNLLFGNQAIALAGIGMACFQKGAYAEAEAAYREAIESNPRFAAAHLHLGETYHALGKWDMALESYRKALELAPDSPEAHYRLALTYMKTQQKEKALVAFSEVLRLAPVSEFATLAKGYMETLK